MPLLVGLRVEDEKKKRRNNVDQSVKRGRNRVGLKRENETGAR